MIRYERHLHVGPVCATEETWGNSILFSSLGRSQNRPAQAVVLQSAQVTLHVPPDWRLSLRGSVETPAEG